MDKLKPMGLTITVIFKGMSLNYGENIGNVSELKKLSKNGEMYSYLSRQALRYDIFRIMREVFGVDKDKENPLTANQDVVQFKPKANIRDYVEVDLFGYMKTVPGIGAMTRHAVVRLTPAISLEPMYMDVEFGTNLDFAKRANANPNPFLFEHHLSHYTYTMTVELDRVGKDKDNNNNNIIEVSPNEKAKRIAMLLDVIKVLNRNIKGRMENLAPLFVIGGVYKTKNPFFLGKMRLIYDKEAKRYSIDTNIIKSTLELSFLDEKLKEKTYIGILDGYWENEEEIKRLLDENRVVDINTFFELLKEEVNNYYGVK